MTEDGASNAGAEPAESAPSETQVLLRRVREGDAGALDELCARFLPPLRRFARGRLPLAVRDAADTDDLVQDTLVRALRHVRSFEPRHEGALLAYLRQALMNRIRDEVRRARRAPSPVELPPDAATSDASPVEYAIGGEAEARYEAALLRLGDGERALVIARIEMGRSYEDLAAAFGKPSPDAARVAVSRALVKLAAEMLRG